MQGISYEKTISDASFNKKFLYEINNRGQLISIRNKDDRYNMNWLNGKEAWGTVVAPDELTVKVSRVFTSQGRLKEKYTFMNKTDFDIFVEKNKVGIITSFPDDYESASICMKERCHAHVWCGKNVAYLYGIRMSGIAPHLGLVLTEGSLDGYSVIRDTEKRSNDRGCIILHAERFHLSPGESMDIAWELTWFGTEEEFLDIVKSYCNGILVTVNKPVAFKGEWVNIQLMCNQKIDDARILKNGTEVNYDKESEKKITICEVALETGENQWDIVINGGCTFVKTLVLPPIAELSRKRCEFIVDKQQYHESGSHLDSGFLVYDTEEESTYYSHLSDHNGGRERVGMGVLLAKYLQSEENEKVDEGLIKYTEYIYRELFDKETGTVYNDVNRNNDWHRLYNYPWMATFFIERFLLFKHLEDLRNVYLIMRSYYKNGGDHFYAIYVPAEETVKLLSANHMDKEAEELKGYYVKHADYILGNGLKFPAHEVNYEQSIVAPAVYILLQVYSLTRDEKYLEGAKEQIKVLELFNGKQPDYHLYETAIRHWDGFWFGKRQLLGDTFPHYWSSLTGIVYVLYHRAISAGEYIEKARASLRGVLSAFKESGEASCAYVYPQTINGQPGSYADPWANDQDWALYFYLKYKEEIERDI